MRVFQGRDDIPVLKATGRQAATSILAQYSQQAKDKDEFADMMHCQLATCITILACFVQGHAVDLGMDPNAFLMMVAADVKDEYEELKKLNMFIKAEGATREPKGLPVL